MTTNIFTCIVMQAGEPWLLMSDKIYSVLTILLVIFGLLSLYLVATNRKINELEEKMDKLENES